MPTEVETRPYTDEDVADALAMSDVEFRDVVGQMLREGFQSEDWKLLLSANLCRRTKASLAGIRTELGADLGGAGPAFRRTMARVTTSARVAVLQTTVEERSALVRAYRNVLGVLAAEVAVHRLATLAAGVDPEDHDRALWARLADLTVPEGAAGCTLDEALGRGLLRGDPDAA